MRKQVSIVAVGALIALMVPTMARAQATISGLVHDSTGAVLPGVSVEASSPTLIEQTRTAVSDSAGRFTIVDLRPGTYTVSFSLPGFDIAVTSIPKRANASPSGSTCVFLAFQSGCSFCFGTTYARSCFEPSLASSATTTASRTAACSDSLLRYSTLITISLAVMR